MAPAKVCFEPMGNGSIHDPALRNTGVRFVGGSSQSAPRSSMEMPRHLEATMRGRRAGVVWSLDLMRAADRREGT